MSIRYAKENDRKKREIRREREKERIREIEREREREMKWIERDRVKGRVKSS